MQSGIVRAILQRLALVLGLLAVAGVLGLVALGFSAAALYLFLRTWMVAPLAALLTSAISVGLAVLILWLAGRSGRAGLPVDTTEYALVRQYPLESSAMAFTAGFLVARSKATARVIGERLFSILLSH